jgi:2-dehydro-3-deoxyphosphogluconate aldolase/(4S)-4-hydroxy-2-oxoglutarate aldolase
MALLHGGGLIPIVRVGSAEIALRVVEVLVDAGVDIVEVTMTVPSALAVIRSVARRFGGDVVVGAGTVTDGATVRRAVNAGAEFVVSPGLVPEVITETHSAGAVAIPGALTPTELLTAVSAGADLIKIFPVQSVGGPAYVRALRGPFPTTPLVPTGGVTLETIGEYVRAGAAAVGVGGELIQAAAIERGDYAAIGELATRFVRAARDAQE